MLLAVIKTCRKERGYCASRSQAIDCLSSVLLHKGCHQQAIYLISTQATMTQRPTSAM